MAQRLYFGRFGLGGVPRAVFRLTFSITAQAANPRAGRVERAVSPTLIGEAAEPVTGYAAPSILPATATAFTRAAGQTKQKVGVPRCER